MDHTPTALHNASLAALIDQDIAHIRRVMKPSLLGDLAGPILPPAYWRTRLNKLLDSGHLTHAQLCAVDSLLLTLGQSDPADNLPAWKTLPLGAHEKHPAPTQRIR